MVQIVLDPNMYYASMSTPQTLYKAKELGFDGVELSPNEEFHLWHHYPKADDRFVDEMKKAVRDTGIPIVTLNPVFNWSSTDEVERKAQVRNWKRLLELADQLDVRTIVSEFSGNPNTPRECEGQWLNSMEELAPLFERYGIHLNMEPHPYDFIETQDQALRLVRCINTDWIGYEFCCPHVFHISEGKGDVERLIDEAAPWLGEVHVADALNHLANDGNRYIVNPPGVDARVHQHAEIGKGEVPFERIFDSLRKVGFDGIMSVCIFGWHEIADEANARVLKRLREEFPAS
ncbi:MAG: sugar phosphate isomerase/epimerase family protein [Actinomycetaceae bacterium]|nr:sugar phosphate isomerase/epimerase family protein [Actinomycetaceae bacterium]MDU0970186.1 sugar phosphate isomerase/epimerase family protein [Actinomycetaceae bacterium]